MTTIQIPTGELQALLGKAILESLSEEAKSLILIEAIKHLNQPRNRFGDTRYNAEKTTPLQDAFDDAVTKITNTVVTEFVEEHLTDKVTATVKGMIENADPDWDLDDLGKVNVMTSLFNEVRRSRG